MSTELTKKEEGFIRISDQIRLIKTEKGTVCDVDFRSVIAKRTEIMGKDREMLMLSEPNPAWLKNHPMIKTKDAAGNTVPLKYIPIDKVEFLLDVLYPKKKIEIKDTKVSFNAVMVVVSVSVFDPELQEWLTFDGIGSMEVQTAAGASPADLNQIKSGALQKAWPAAKSYAIKDATDHLGNVFGRNLNRNSLDFVTEVARAEAVEDRKEMAYMEETLATTVNPEDLNRMHTVAVDRGWVELAKKIFQKLQTY